MSPTTSRAGRRFSARPRSGASRRAGILALTLALLAGPAVAAVHPFYVEAMRAGQEAYERGDYAEAVRRFEIAGFGMLEDVPILAETLTRLALAQAADDERQDFVATYERISELEETFRGYSEAPLSPAMRREFETRVLQWVPAQTLRQSASFADLYRRQELERLRAMLPGARVRALAELVEQEPDDPRWRMMLATARVESGSGGEAIETLEAIRDERPTSQRVACLLGRAQLQSGRCETILQQPLDTVHRCDVRRLPQAELVQYLDCLAAADRWLEAARVVVSLPTERRESRPFPNWEKRIARRMDPGVEVDVLPPFEIEEPEAEVDPAPSASAEPSAQLMEPTNPIPVAAPAGREWPSEELATLRQRLTRADSVEALERVVAAAVDLQARFPRARREFQFLAGEAAYRASDWRVAADHLGAGGGPPDERYDLLFYLAVSLYELGDVDAARAAMSRAAPGLAVTPLVERYEQLIFGSGG